MRLGDLAALTHRARPPPAAPAAAPGAPSPRAGRSGGSVSHTAAATSRSSLTASASCPDTITSAVFAGGSAPRRTTRPQPAPAARRTAATPPATPAPPTPRGAADASRQIRPRAPGSSPTLPSTSRQRSTISPVPGPPPQHLQLDAAQLARRRHQPHPLRQRIHNMSSSTPTRPAPARPTSRSRSAIRACLAGHRVAFATATEWVAAARRRPTPRPPRRRAPPAAAHPAADRRRGRLHPVRPPGRQPDVHARLAAATNAPR